MEGDVMEATTEHGRHQVMDICEDGNVDRVTRVLDLAFADCVELCYSYTKHPVDDGTILDDTLDEQAIYEMRLSVPEKFSFTTLNLLRSLIHELLVYKVLYDWTSITKPDSKTNWQEKIEDAEKEIQAILNTRIGRIRRTQTPW